MLRCLSVTIVVTLLFSSSLALAQSQDPEQMDRFPPSPLELTTPDPLLPNLSKKRELTLAEQLQLQAALNDLNQQAIQKLQAGDRVAAFEIWNRELRLRRFLGLLEEVQALSRVGTYAWNESDRQETFYITERLQAIQKQIQSPKKVAKKNTQQKTVDLELLRSLAQAYQNVRSIKPAIEVYNQILATVRQQQDAVAVVETLNIIGQLHLTWFDYPKAAAAYEELLSLATKAGDRTNELAYIQQLAYIYDQGKQPQQAINKLDQLAKIYVDENNLTEIPKLKIAIATNYETLGRENPNLLTEAFNNYQEAYTTAWQLQQFTRAGEALQKIIALYRSQGQIDEALQTSQILVVTQEQAANFYGLMEAYDQIGQMYLQRKEYTQALTAFQKGLQLAKQLKHQEAYFTQQIEKVPK